MVLWMEFCVEVDGARGVERKCTYAVFLEGGGNRFCGTVLYGRVDCTLNHFGGESLNFHVVGFGNLIFMCKCFFGGVCT